MKTYFDESEWCVTGCSKLDIDDDSDAGGELFVRAGKLDPDASASLAPNNPETYSAEARKWLA